MLVYIIKFSMCLVLFLAVYKILLEKENMHVFKRFYLLVALMVSALFPLITFTQYVEVESTSNVVIQNVIANTSPEISEGFMTYLPTILWSVYITGVLVFTIRFISNLSQLNKRIKNNPKQRVNSFTNVLLKDTVAPHSFFSFIFFNKAKYDAQEIPQEVFWHEQTHAKQKHSIDVLLIEIFQVIFWFNPLIYATKHVIKLNHEFLADQGVLNKGINTTNYQETILAFSSNAPQSQLASAINYSLIKKRFTVMKTKTSKQKTWLKSLVLLPLLAISLYSFSDTIIVERDIYTETLNLQEGATKKQIAEYNKLAKKFSAIEGSKNITIRKKDVDRIEYLYSLMTNAQKESAEPFPNIPPPPAPVAIQVIPPPPPPIPADATPAQKKKYKAAIKNYEEKKVKLKVERLPPPPPPIPANATEAQKKKYNQVLRQYEEKKARAAARALKAKPMSIRVINAKEKAKLKAERKVLKEKAAKLKNKERELVRVQELKEVEQKRLYADKKAYRENRAAKNKNQKKYSKEEISKSQERERKREIEARKSAIETAKKKIKAEKKKLEKAKKKQEKEKDYELEEVEELEIEEVEEAYEEVEIREVSGEIEELPKSTEEIEIEEITEVPPPPKSPLDHVIDMAKKDATFYFENKKISSDKAIELLKSNGSLNIMTNHSSGSDYIVKISSKPIVIED